MFPSIPNQLHANASRLGGNAGRREVIVEIDANGVRRSLTFAELIQSAQQLAVHIKQCKPHSLPQQQKHALLAGNTLECHIFYLACAMLGCTAVPINNTFTPHEIRQVLLATKPTCLWFQPAFALNASKAVVSQHRRREIAQLLPLPSLEQLQLHMEAAASHPEENTYKLLHRNWVILHTSGSTSGRKKGVIRNQFGTIAGIMLHQSALQITENDVYMAVWPSYGISTFFFTFGMLYLGARVVIVDSALDSARCWRVLEQENVTFTTGSPLQFENWLNCAKNSPNSKLRCILLSGSMVSDALSSEVCNAFQQCAVWEAYGSTECGLISLRNHRNNAHRGVGVEPAGIPAVDICKSTGEIMVHTSSPMFMNGYVHYTHSEARAWFRTGDVGRRDASGQLILLGRADSRISLPNGHDLYPEEVEVVLQQCELPVEVAGVVVTYVNRQLIGVITLAEEMDISARKALVHRLEDFATERLAPLKRPTKYEFMRSEELPVTTTLKVKRKDLVHVMSARL